MSGGDHADPTTPSHVDPKPPTGGPPRGEPGGGARSLPLADRRLAGEYLLFGLTLGSFLAGALVATAGSALLAVARRQEVPLGGEVPVLPWATRLSAAAAVLAAAAALAHARWDRARYDVSGHIVARPRPRLAVVAACLAAGPAVVTVILAVRPRVSEGEVLDRVVGVGAPSRPVAVAVLLALVGSAATVAWSRLRLSRLRHEVDTGPPPGEVPGAPVDVPAAQVRCRAPAAVLGGVVAILLAAIAWPAGGALRTVAQNAIRSPVVRAEALDPDADHGAERFPGAGPVWSRDDLRRAIPAGDLVVGVGTKEVDGTREWSTVWGLRPDDGARLWRWSVRSRVSGFVVDPVDRAVLVVLDAAVVVLTFDGDMVKAEALPGDLQWSVASLPGGRRPYDPYEAAHPPGLARTVVLQGYEHHPSAPRRLLALEVATGTVRWRADVPPDCTVDAAPVPASPSEAIGADVLVSFGGGLSCRTHLYRIGPDGLRWSVSLTDDPAARVCPCHGVWPTPLDTDLIAVVIDRPGAGLARRPELLVLDGDGRPLATWPFHYILTQTYLVEASARAGTALVGALEGSQITLYDLATGARSVAVDGLRDVVTPAAVWPRVVAYRPPDTLVLYDASDGMRPVTELALPAERGCRREGFIDAYAGQIALTCTDGASPTGTTVVSLPPP